MLDSAANWGTSDGFSRLSSCDSSDANEALSQGEDFCVLQDTAEGHFTQRCVNQIDQVYLVSRLFGPVTPALELTTESITSIKELRGAANTYSTRALVGLERVGRRSGATRRGTAFSLFSSIASRIYG